MDLIHGVTNEKLDDNNFKTGTIMSYDFIVHDLKT